MVKKSLQILHLEDEEPAVELVQAILLGDQLDVTVDRVESHEEYLSAIREKEYDLIFSDYSLPQFDGLTALSLAKETCPNTPFIFITGAMGEEVAIQTLKNGATDYVLKNQLEKLVPAVNRAMQEQKSKLEKLQLERKLHKMAYYDVLTNMPNRQCLQNKIDELLIKAKDNPDDAFAILYIDLNRFKQVNDSFGHHIGDELLRSVATELKKNVRPDDFVARLGGDEFAILLNEIRSDKQISDVVDRIIARLNSPIQLESRQHYTSCSIGVAKYKDTYESADQILRDADIAMYSAKKHGGNHCKYFSLSNRERIINNLQIETDLWNAFYENELDIYYQPIVTCETGKIEGFEALLRWFHPEKGMISPEEFVHVAEESGSIIAIGDWILKAACKQMKEWNDDLCGSESCYVSVNVSARQFQHANFLKSVDDALIQSGLDPKLLQLELTEKALVEDLDEVREILSYVRDKDIKISLDDFGVGYSSLFHLTQLQIDNLKIDRAFTINMIKNNKKLEIIRSVISLGKSLEMKVIVEGVEEEVQLNELRNLKCESVQGYYISKPIPTSDVPDFVRKYRKKKI